MTTSAPDSKTLSSWVNKALVQATYDLAGINQLDTSTQAFLTAATSSSALGSVLPAADYVPPESQASDLLNLNSTLFRIADVMPDPTALMYGTGSNSRYTNYGTYLNWVDTGASVNTQSQKQYELTRQNYMTSLGTLRTDLATAHVTWVKTHPDTDVGFVAWASSTAYWDYQTIRADQQDVTSKQSLYNTAAQLYLGALGAELVNWQDDFTNGGEKTAELGYTMQLFDQSYRPAYTLPNIEAYETWWNGTQISTNTQSPPFVRTATLDISGAQSIDLSEYGLTETATNTEAFLDVPFICWGNMSSYSKSEMWSTYNSNNVQAAGVTMQTWSTPYLADIEPGQWYDGNPLTTFTKLISGAPSTPADLVYPFVSQIAVTYGVGLKINLDQASYSNLQTTVNQKSSTSSVVLFGAWFFTAEQSTGNSSQFNSTYNQMTFNDSDHSVTINPQHIGIPTVLGVVVNKAASSTMTLQTPSSMALISTPTLKATGSVNSFLQKLHRHFSGLDNNLRYRLLGSLHDFFKMQESIEVVVQALRESLNELEDFAKDGTEISLEQRIGHALLSLTIRSWGPNNNKHGNSRYARSVVNSDKKQKVIDGASQLMPALHAEAFSHRQPANGAVKPSQMLTMGLANMAGIELHKHLPNASDAAHELVKGILDHPMNGSQKQSSVPGIAYKGTSELVFHSWAVADNARPAPPVGFGNYTTQGERNTGYDPLFRSIYPYSCDIYPGPFEVSDIFYKYGTSPTETQVPANQIQPGPMLTIPIKSPPQDTEDFYIRFTTRSTANPPAPPPARILVMVTSFP